MHSLHNIPKQSLKSLDNFVDRREELIEIKENLKPASRSWLIVVTGLGGIGKTTLALKVAWEALKEDLYDVVVWTSAKEQRFDPKRGEVRKIHPWYPPFLPLGKKPLTSLEQLLNEIYRVFGQRIQHDWDKDKVIRQAYELLRQYRTLVVVDNFDSLEEQALKEIGNFLGRDLPQPTKAIVTSRAPLDIPGQVLIRLGGMQLEGVQQLVKQRCVKWSVPKSKWLSDHEIEIVFDLTFGIPLAIEMVIARLKRGSKENLLNSLTLQKSKGYEQLLGFLFTQTFRESLRHSQIVWLTLSAVGKPMSIEDIIDKTGLERYLVVDAIDWLSFNGLLNRAHREVSLHPYAIQYGRYKLITEETLPIDLEKRLEKLAGDTKA